MSNKFQILTIDNMKLPTELRGSVVAIGNFDGFHRGHRAVIEKTMKKADENNCPAILLTFSPHPRTYFSPDNPVYLLTPPDLKSKLAQRFGFSGLIFHTFDQQFSALSADQFISEILVNKLGANHVVTGYDFHFGKKRQGTPEYLQGKSTEFGLGVTLVDACQDEGGEIISSSRIREHLANGEISQANGLLGYAYQISGTVIHGQKLGRKLGFPTANMELPQDTKLRHGIYAVRAIRENGESYDGVASFGRRPTIDDGGTLFETFLFDFSEDIYGENLTVIIYAWLRAEEKFPGTDELVDQMKIDKSEAEQFLMALPPDHKRWPIGTNE